MSPQLRCLVLVLLALGLAGCNTWSDRCESLCGRLVDECGFTAWSSSEQCRVGCVDDMYRRHDAAELLACYEAAIDPPDSETAEQRVRRAREGGLFDDAISAGSFDEAAEVQRAVELGTCDAFAFVQCKVEAVQVAPQTPLVED